MAEQHIVTEQIIEAPQRHVVLPLQYVSTLKAVADPSVKNVLRFRASGEVITITKFREGQPGQEIKILGDGTTTVEENTSIVTNNGDILLEADSIYTFTNIDGVWYLDSVAVGSGGGGGSGEANTGSNVGTGSQVFKTKVGVDLQFRSLVAGSGISITQSANEILIGLTAGPGTEIPFRAANGAIDNIALVSGDVPFREADGTVDNIALVGGEVPFREADGTIDNIALV